MKRNIDREFLTAAVKNIRQGIFWPDTPQGFSYWRDVISNLEQLIREDEIQEDDKANV